MSMLLSLALLMTVAPGDSCATPTAATSLTPTYAGRELDQAVHAALRRWARPSKADVEPAAREFLALYQNVQKDTTLAFVTQATGRQAALPSCLAGSGSGRRQRSARLGRRRQGPWRAGPTCRRT